MFKLIFICPDKFNNSYSLPSFGNLIKLNEIISASKQSCNIKKGIIIFIGEFCDSFGKSFFNYFLSFNHSDYWKFYITFNGSKYFIDLLKRFYSYDFKIYVVAHSWGANELIMALSKQNNFDIRIDYMLTLDPVGYRRVKFKPNCVKLWENIYIKNHLSLIKWPNILALIGHPKKYIKYADINNFFNSPFHHNNINFFINSSSLLKLL